MPTSEQKNAQHGNIRGSFPFVKMDHQVWLQRGVHCFLCIIPSSSQPQRVRTIIAIYKWEIMAQKGNLSKAVCCKSRALDLNPDLHKYRDHALSHQAILILPKSSGKSRSGVCSVSSHWGSLVSSEYTEGPPASGQCAQLLLWHWCWPWIPAGSHTSHPEDGVNSWHSRHLHGSREPQLSGTSSPTLLDRSHL